MNENETRHEPPKDFPETTPETVWPPNELSSAKNDQEIMSWCPGGNASGGICTPFNNSQRATWMASYGSAFHLRPEDMILPGTHNSGMDKKASYTNSSNTCQDVSPYDQLMTGIRVLDIRTRFLSGNSAARRFAIYHDLESGRTIEGDILDTLLRYRSNAKANNEIVILDFHQFDNFTDAAHRELHTLIKQKLGFSIIPLRYRGLTCGQYRYLGLNTIIAYNHSLRENFWPGVNQRWIGENTPSNDKLHDFINGVGAETKPATELRSIQCTKYSLPFFTPKDLSERVMNWFASNTYPAHGRNQNFYIINTDWSLRNRLIDNCIHGNAQRVRIRGARVDYLTPKSLSSSGIPTEWCSVFQAYDGDWRGDIYLKRNFADTTSTTVICVDSTLNVKLSMADTNCNIGVITLYRGDRITFKTPKNSNAQLICETYTPNDVGAEAIAPWGTEKIARYVLSDGDHVAAMQLSSHAQLGGIIVVKNNATYSVRIDTGNIESDFDYLDLSTGQQYAFEYTIESRWKIISRT